MKHMDYTETVPAEGTMFKSPTFKFLDFLFGIPIIHDIMFGVYRKQIVEKSGESKLVFLACKNHTTVSRLLNHNLLSQLCDDVP